MGKWRYITLTPKELAKCRVEALAGVVVVVFMAIGLVYVMDFIAVMIVVVTE